MKTKLRPPRVYYDKKSKRFYILKGKKKVFFPATTSLRQAQKIVVNNILSNPRLSKKDYIRRVAEELPLNATLTNQLYNRMSLLQKEIDSQREKIRSVEEREALKNFKQRSQQLSIPTSNAVKQSRDGKFRLNLPAFENELENRITKGLQPVIKAEKTASEAFNEAINELNPNLHPSPPRARRQKSLKEAFYETLDAINPNLYEEKPTRPRRPLPPIPKEIQQSVSPDEKPEIDANTLQQQKNRLKPTKINENSPAPSENTRIPSPSTLQQQKNRLKPASKAPIKKPVSPPATENETMWEGLKSAIESFSRQINPDLLNDDDDDDEDDAFAEDEVKEVVKQAVKSPQNIKREEPEQRGAVYNAQRREAQGLSPRQRLAARREAQRKGPRAGVTLRQIFIENMKRREAQGKEEEDDEDQAGTGTGKKWDEDGLYSQEIDYFMKPFRKYGYLGTVPANRVHLLRPDKNVFSFIMNTSPAHIKDDGHWVAVYVDGSKEGNKEIAYYDSYGDKPDNKFLKEIKPVIDSMRLPYYLKFKYNLNKEQRANSNNCGYFAMKYLIDRYAGKDHKLATGFNKVLESEREIKKFKKQFKEPPQFDYI